MLDAVQRYVHERRRGLIQTASFLYGSYAFSTYVSQRLDETKDKMLRKRLARDNLRRRFQSTHDDVCFTIMALMPTLASQILEDMDVEALTHELQSISRASRSRTLLPAQSQQLSQSLSELSSVSDVNSDAGSVSFSSYSESAFDGDHTSASSGSWVDHMSTTDGSSARPDATAQLSDSLTSTSSSLSQNGRNPESSVASTSSRTRGQLWNEVKILALTRTLTTLYTITLLSLLTAVQLNLLGRSRYMDSVRASERAERERDQVPDFSLTGILAREAVAGIVDVEAIWPAWILGATEDGDEEDDEKLDAIPEKTELHFLTLSWWMLHVGWKDVAARVRSAVENVFDEVPLKNKLSPSDLFTLLMDVRRRVETAGMGSKPDARFLSSLLPPTPETTAHVLAQGGALRIPRENEIPDNINRFLSRNSPSYDPNHSWATRGDIELPMPPLGTSHGGPTPATAIPIESPRPLHAVFPTPPSSYAPESDVSSRASQSPTNSFAPHLQPTVSIDVSDSLAMSPDTLDMDPQFTALLAQTRRYLSGPDFAHALGCALDRATDVLMDGLRARVFVDTASAVNVPNAEEARVRSRTGDCEERDEIKIRLAGLLPGLARWCQLALNGTPNELVDNIMAVREVNALEAIVISDYEDRFPPIS